MWRYCVTGVGMNMCVGMSVCVKMYDYAYTFVCMFAVEFVAVQKIIINMISFFSFLTFTSIFLSIGNLELDVSFLC